MTADINSTLRNAGDGLGFLLDEITDPLIVLVIGLGIASAIVLLFGGIVGKIKNTVRA